MIDERRTMGGRFLRLILRLIGFLVVVLMVWVTYVYLYAYQPDFLGWCFQTLRPVTVRHWPCSRPACCSSHITAGTPPAR